MSLFTPTRINAFLNNSRISDFLKKNHCILLRKEQVDEYLQQAPLSISRETRVRSKTSKDKIHQNTRLKDFISMQYEVFRKNIMTRICRHDCSAFDYDLLLEHDPEIVDILYVFRNRYKYIPQKIVNESQYIEYKLTQVCGFILIKKGECANNRSLYTILCCGALEYKFIPFLIGMTAFIIKTDPMFAFKHLFSYSDSIADNTVYHKYGFRKDSYIVCLNDKSLVSSDLSLMSSEDIIHKAVSLGYGIEQSSKSISMKSHDMKPKKSVKDLIAEYERKIQSSKGGNKRNKTRKKIKKCKK